MKPSEILYKGARVLERRGWTRGEFEDGDGKVCIRGAMNLVVHGHPELAVADTDEVIKHEFAKLVEPFAVPSYYKDPMVYFNDCKAKNKTEVVRTMRSIARKLKEQGM